MLRKRWRVRNPAVGDVTQWVFGARGLQGASFISQFATFIYFFPPPHKNENASLLDALTKYLFRDGRGRVLLTSQEVKAPAPTVTQLLFVIFFAASHSSHGSETVRPGAHLDLLKTSCASRTQGGAVESRAPHGMLTHESRTLSPAVFTRGCQ